VAIIGSAGTTNTGAIDPLEKIASISKQFNIWFHIDGAYGAPFLLTKAGHEKLKFIAEADSIALDPHKSLSLPYGTGLLLVRDRNHLSTDYGGSATYMPPSSGLTDPELRLDFADIGPELSRDFRGLRVWLPIKILSIEPFQLNLEEKLSLSEYLHQELSKVSDIVVEAAPQLSILAFRHKNAEITRKLMGQINAKENVFLSGCTLPNEKFVIRVCMLGHHLHFQQVQTLLNDLKFALKEISN
jgi:aromatic-L-amino-acid decarboxylase